MADISKMKFPGDNTTYNIKDTNAGYSVEILNGYLNLKNSAGNIISTVQLPKEKFTMLDSGTTVTYAGNHPSTMSGATQLQIPTFIAKRIYLIEENTKNLICSFAFIDAREEYCKAQYTTGQADTIGAGLTIKSRGFMNIDGVTFYGLELNYPDVEKEIYKGCYTREAWITHNNVESALLFKYDNTGAIGYLTNGTNASISLNNYATFDAKFLVSLTPLLEVINEDAKQYIYDIYDNYNQWAPSYTKFNFKIGGEGSHVVTNLAIKKFNDSTMSWDDVTPLSYTQTGDLVEINGITTGLSSDLDKTDLLKLLVTTSVETSSILLSPNCKIYA